jgi:hypothetical protein
MKKLLLAVICMILALQINAQYTKPQNLQDRFGQEPMPLRIGERTKPSDSFRQRLLNPRVNSHQGVETTSSVVQRLDSLLFEFNWTGPWTPWYKKSFTWNAAQQLIMDQTSGIDFYTGQLVPYDRRTFQYNAAGELTLEIFEYADFSTGVYEYESKSEYTWDNGLLKSHIYHYYDRFNSTWMINDSVTYHYLPNGSVSHTTSSFWDDWSNQWVTGPKVEYTYNSGGDVTVILFSFYDDWSQQYIPDSRELFQYHANGKISITTTEYYDPAFSQWIATYKVEMGYDQSGNNTTKVQSYYDSYTMVWFYSIKEAKTFDVSNNLTALEYSWFNDLTGLWEPMEKEEYDFNNTYSFNDLLIPVRSFDVDVKELFNHMITHLRMYEYDDALMSWQQSGRGELYWSLQVIGIAENDPRDVVKVYPNPAVSFLMVESGDLHEQLVLGLYDLQGRQVMEQAVVPGQGIDISGMPTGLYIYRVHSSSRYISQGKIVIRR